MNSLASIQSVWKEIYIGGERGESSIQAHPCDTYRVFIGELGPPVYECDVTIANRSSAPADLIAFTMFTWLPQPSDSQHPMPTCDVRFAASSAECRILMKSAACCPFEFIPA